MQQDDRHITLITPTAPVQTHTHGGRAKCLQRLVRLNLPVPRTVALSFEAVHRIAAGEVPDMVRFLAPFGDAPLLCVRPSSEDPDWGGPGAVLNIGINDTRFVELSDRIGKVAASHIYLRFVQAYAIHVARLDPDVFEDVSPDPVLGLSQALKAYETEAEEEFPQDPGKQLTEVLRSMARAWEGTTARLLRQAKGAPADAGLGLVVQELALGLGQGECGSGVMQLVNGQTGARQIIGRYLSQSQGREALSHGADAIYLTRDPRGPSLEELAPEAFAEIRAHAEVMRARLREEM
ncbi:MAG: pyruvate, phosphate dikinase, partial [Roseovarius sp.]